MSLDATSATTYPQTSWRMPAGATDLLLIRHGQSAPMPIQGYPTADGHADPELSEVGREQAERLAERLHDVGLVAIYVSSLVRTHQTAAPLSERTGLTPVVEADLREIHLGEWEGGEFRRRVEAREPEAAQLVRHADWAQIPGAEQDEVFAARVDAALTRIGAAHPGQRVAVVCHGGVIGQALALATGASTKAFMFCDNAAITQLVFHGGAWTVRNYNDSAHLGPVFTRTAEPVI